MIRELPPEETYLAYAAMLLLRPGIGSEADFVRRVNNTQRLQGYRLVGTFAEGDSNAAAAAGFRVAHFLAWGDVLYCDDLSSRPEFRRQGHASKLLDWMIEEARRLGCNQFHLDSGVGIDRQDAHRLYMNKGMRISSHHFQLEL